MDGQMRMGVRHANCRIRTGFAFHRHSFYATGNCEWSYGESRVKYLTGNSGKFGYECNYSLAHSKRISL